MIGGGRRSAISFSCPWARHARTGAGEPFASVCHPVVYMMSRTLSLLAALLALSRHASAVDFDHDIRPIIAEHCLECHSLDKAKGGLALISREAAMKKLKSGVAALVPGQPEASEVLKRVTSSDEDEVMPPKDKKPLTVAQVATLKQWISQGAEWPAHWAYRPITKPEPPALSAADIKVGNSIDRFILAKLEAAKLAPSPEAGRVTLMRRVWYDLLGLPPTPEEVDAFVNDKSANAYEHMVDAALASPHYGERWGRHWLDMARYADSDGYEKDKPRPDAWRYRDWVIHAVNADLPFDQFTIEQIAGDLLPDATQEQLVATAFHRQTLTNTEGGTDQEQFRIEACFDRTETTGAVWLGLTVGCARCHSHKYDQLTQREYYQMFAFYNNGDEVTRQVPVSQAEWSAYEKANGAEAAKLAVLQRKVDEARANLRRKLPDWEKTVQPRLAAARAANAKAEFKPLDIAKVTATSKTSFKKLSDGSQLATGKVPANDTYTVEIDRWSGSLSSLRLEVLPDDSLPGKGPGRSKNGNFVLSEVKLSVGSSAEQSTVVPLHSPQADATQAKFEAAHVLDGNAQTGWALAGHLGKPHQLTLQISRPLGAQSGQKLFLTLSQDYKQGDHVVGRFRLLGSSVETVDSIAPAAVVKVLDEYPDRRNPALIPPLFEWLEKVDDDFVTAASALELAKARLPKPPLMDVRVIAQRTVNPRTTKLLQRGDFLSPADPVLPGAIGVLPVLKLRDETKPDRLDLARWLVSRDNPLTPRVTVNHVWARLFGEGLVRTVSDFGVRGERPTHPELLDWLASEFMEQGWSRKKLLKLILMSATYRQSSVQRPELTELDPQNKLLARQNRLRVEGEIIRDLHLAVSGLLSPKIGGPSVFPPMPEDIANLSYANNFKWTTSKGEDSHRRGLYTFFKRTAPHPDLMTFDCPDANTTNVKRTVSNTPLQALTTLNAEAFTEAAKALAKRVLEASLINDDERIARLFRLCVSRALGEKELKALRSLLYDSRAWYAQHGEEAKALTKGSEVKQAPADEVAAWTATARIVLNLDEFVTRE